MGEDKYMAISINYRGDIKSKEANATVQWLKQNNKISFVEWCPTGFKIGLNEVPAAIVEGDITAPAKNNVTMRLIQMRNSKHGFRVLGGWSTCIIDFDRK